MKVYATVSVDAQQPAAWEWASKLANYCNQNYSGTTVEVLSRIHGNVNKRIFWISRHESLGDAEAFMEWYNTDEGFQKIWGEAQEQGLVDGTDADRTFWRIR